MKENLNDYLICIQLNTIFKHAKKGERMKGVWAMLPVMRMN